MHRARVLRFLSPEIFLLAGLFSAQFLIRTILDWFVPPADFHTRATVSTVLGAVTLFSAGFLGSRRLGSLAMGVVSGVMTASLAAIMSITCAAVLLALAHDPQTMAAIRGSGGLEEVFSLPLLMILPAAVLGLVGGLAYIASKSVLCT